jgi:hypothetical protein
MVNAIRDTGSEHLILLGGVQYSNSLTRWLEYMPVDPLENLGAAWHVYNFNACSDEACWDQAPFDVAQEVPVVTTELGQDDCEGDFIQRLMNWLDGSNLGYLAWTWNAHGACQPTVRGGPGMREEGMPWSLVSTYDCPIPNGRYAETFYQHLQDAAP